MAIIISRRGTFSPRTMPFTGKLTKSLPQLFCPQFQSLGSSRPKSPTQLWRRWLAFTCTSKLLQSLIRLRFTLISSASGLSQISTDYLRRMPRVRKYFVLKFSFMVFNGMLFNIVLRDCGFMLTIHKILNLKPARFTDDFPLSYEYAEDAQIPEMIVDGQQQQCDCREVICRHFKEADFQERLETFCSCHYGDWDLKKTNSSSKIQKNPSHYHS